MQKPPENLLPRGTPLPADTIRYLMLIPEQEPLSVSWRFSAYATAFMLHRFVMLLADALLFFPLVVLLVATQYRW